MLMNKNFFRHCRLVFDFDSCFSLAVTEEYLDQVVAAVVRLVEELVDIEVLLPFESITLIDD